MSTTRIRLDKQSQLAANSNMFPLSDANKELQLVGLIPAVRSAETQTQLNSVELLNGNLVIKYTPENGVQQVVSTPLSLQGVDINVANAVLENPGAGVYRLVISETDGSQYPVDLSALVAMLGQNSADINLVGNGTPASPLTATITQAFKNSIPKKLSALDDVQSNQGLLDTAIQETGIVTLCWDIPDGQWKPKNTKTLLDFVEVTETFRVVENQNTIALLKSFQNIELQSIKVFRNGLRQLLVDDYNLNSQNNQIVFVVPFESNRPEIVLVDYRPLFD
jgi:hypothetical protein